MIYPQNLHTHGVLCDGKCEYEDMVKSAIEQGFESIGFSGHSHTDFDESYCMSEENTLIYRKLIGKLKDKYNGKIDIYCGIEYDVFSDDEPMCYDYVIGDCHYVKAEGKYFPVDGSADEVKNLIANHFGGDGLKFAKAYYENVSLIAKLKKCDIAGHFDLLMKNNELLGYIDPKSDKYRNLALDAVTAVAEKVKVFEINVGSIARGYRSIPYPEDFLLRRIKELGCGVVISTDCHDSRYLATNMDTGINLAKETGFDEVLILTKDGFKGIKI